MNKKSLKTLALIISVTLVSIALLTSPVGAVTSPAFSNWYWTGDTNASSVVVADANNDHANDVVVAGYYNDGTGWGSQVHVLNCATYAVENVGGWKWGSNSQINSIAVGDVNNDGLNETVIGGATFDGTTWNSLVAVLTLSTTSTAINLVNIGTWLTGVKSVVSSVAIGDVNGDAINEIVAAGSYYDGTGWNAAVNVITPSTTTTGLNMLISTTWKTLSGSTVASVAIGDVNNDALKEIVTGGSLNDGTRANSEVKVLNCATNFASITTLNSASWFWTGATYVNSIAIANIGPAGINYLIAAGSFFDGSRTNSVIHILNIGATIGVQVVNTGYWVWTGNTQVNSVCVGSFTGSTTQDIITGGSYFDGQRTIAQAFVLDSSTLATRAVANWFTTSNTQINSISVGATPLGIRVFGAGSFFDNTRSEAQLTVWAS